MAPLTIVIINDFAHITGGAAKVALLSAVGLARRGHDVTVFSAVEPVTVELRDKRIKMVCTGQQEILTDTNRIRAACQGLWNIRAASRMARLLDSCDPSRTVIHLHGWTKSLSSSVVREAVSREFPIVCTLHDYFVACPNGGFFNYQTSSICTLQAMSRACVTTDCDKSGYLHKLWRVSRQGIQERWGHVPSGIDHFITISNFSRNILNPYLPPGAALHNVPNPIVTSKEPPVRCADNSSFIAVGRLSPEKGIFLFAEAGRNVGTVPLFVGDGESRRELELRFPEVIVTGWQSETEVRKCMTRARTLVLPSLWYETQGLVVLEAASLGIPAIVPDNCAASESVVDGVTGLHFKSGNCDDLSDKMRRLQDREIAARVGQAAYERFWADPPTMERHLDGLEAVYERVAVKNYPGDSDHAATAHSDGWSRSEEARIVADTRGRR